MLSLNKSPRAPTLLFILLVLSSVPQFAQTSGAIAGTVRDQSGAVVSGAEVTVRNHATEYQRVVTTSELGEFLVPLLPPGDYEVTVQAPGFRKAVFPNVTVRVTETTSINPILGVGGATESLSVNSETSFLQTDGPQLGRVIGPSTISALPLATRNFTQILTLSPGATSYLPDSTGVGRNTQLISVNGARAMQNNVEVNGVDVNSMGTNGPIMLPVPAPEAIQEFKVQTALYDAAFGRSAGGSVQMLTKDGTNNMHGVAYEYRSNDALNANNPFLKAAGIKRPVLRRNTFGITWGGPIRRDRAFLFASYQGARERNGASIINSISSNVLIAPPGLTDDRSAATLLNTFKPKLSSGQPATSIDSAALALLNTKLPNGQFLIPNPQADGHYSGSGVSRFEENQFNANFDYLSHKDSFSVKSFVANGPRTLVLAGFRGAGPNVPGFPSHHVQNNRLIVLQDIHSFSSSVLNDVRIGYNFFRNDTTPEEPVNDSDLGIFRSNAAQFPGLGMIRIAPGSGGLIMGSEPTDGRVANSTTTLADTVSVTRGAHNLRTGIEFRYNMVNFDLKTLSRGQIDFQTFNDFLVGSVFKSSLGSGITERSWRAFDYNFFIQDDWKLSPDLTLNLGLRYELDLPPYDTRGRFATFDPAIYQPRTLVENGVPAGPPSAGFVQASNAISSVSAPGVPKVDKRIVNSIDPWNFAPRFGFAWSPRLQTAVRGGYGIYISRSSFQYVSGSTSVPPIYVIGIKSSAPLSNPFLSLPDAGQFPTFIPGIRLSGSAFDRNLDTPYFQQFGLSIQQELRKKMLLEVGYVGTRGLHLFRQVAINQAPLASVQAPIVNAVTGAVITTNTPANANVSLRAPLQGVDISGFSQFQSTAQSTYHSLQTTLAKEISFGLQFLGSYTYSKSIDNSSGQGGGAGTAGLINPSAVGDVSPIFGDQRNSRANRGLSDFDRTHRLVFSSVWDLPRTRLFETSRPARFLLSNWKTSAIAVLMSGLPIDVVDTGAGSLYGLAGGGSALARPSLAPGFASCSDAMRNVPAGYFFNPAVFARPIVNAGQAIPSSGGAAVADAVGTDIGNVGRNCLHGPRQTNVDFAITKRFPFSESRNIEFGAEFFNLFNEVNLANPVSNFNAVGASGMNPNTGQVINPGDFGRIISTSNNPRIIQFVLKFNY